MDSIEKKAKQFLVDHPYMEPDLCYQHGYIDGYKYATEKSFSDEIIIKIIDLYNKFGADKVSNEGKVLSVETIKEHLYDNYI